MLMWLKKSVSIINAKLKILDITSLDLYFKKKIFRFRICALNPNMSFHYMKSASRWTKVD